MLQKLERKLGRFAIPNLITLLVGGQAAAFVLIMAKPEMAGALALVPSRVLQGEVWRLVSFLFMPASYSIFFIIFALWLLYLYGRALDDLWGAFRFNLFIFVGWIASVGAAFAVPGTVATNIYLLASITFAFAYLYPDFELLLFFILPVKIKWIALLTAVYFLYAFVMGGTADRLLIAAGLLNFFLFFTPDMIRRARGQTRRNRVEKERERVQTAVNHECTVCGKTDKSDPDMQFRYCSKCSGRRAYCMDHLRDHEHVLD